MSQFTFTTCDCCNYEGYDQSGSGFIDAGPDLAAMSYGWGLAHRKVWRKPMTLSDGYVIEGRHVEEHLHLCPSCLADDDAVDNYRYVWEPDRYDGENFAAAVKRLEINEERDNQREMRVDLMRIWVDINGAPHDDWHRPQAVADYDEERDHWASLPADQVLA